MASEAHSVPSSGYVSKFWVCLHMSGLFPSFGFVWVHLRIFGL